MSRASSSRIRCSSATTARPSPAPSRPRRKPPSPPTWRGERAVARGGRQRGRGQSRLCRRSRGLAQHAPRRSATTCRASTRRWCGRRRMREHLLAQLAVEIHEPADRVIAAHLIDLVDEAGYLTADLDGRRRAARLRRSRASRRRWRGCSASIRPASSPATSPNAWRMQLKERNRYDPAMQRLIENLPLLASRDAAQLMRICGVDAEDLADMVAEIKALDPKPGLAFDAAAAAAGRARHLPAAAGRRRLGRSSSTARPCRASSSTTAITPRSAAPRATRRSATISPSAINRPTGW